MAEKMLRGKAPLTMWRSASSAPSGLCYRGQPLDPHLVDAGDRERLVREDFLEWVERDGDGWKVADAADEDEVGTPVGVGDPHEPDRFDPADPGVVNKVADRPDPVMALETPADPGLVNVRPTQAPEVDDEDAAKEQERAAARSKLPQDGSAPKGNASQQVWAEYAVAQGYDRAEVEKADRDDIRDLFKK